MSVSIPKMPLHLGMPEREIIDPRLDLEAEIKRLRVERKAIILAHYYQDGEIQDIADVVGDSLALAQRARATDAEVIAFCGVHFMAETAKILNMDKIVVMPDSDAGCSLADRCPPDQFSEWLLQYPDHVVVSYINTSASIKALSDIICTSTNAVRVVESIPADRKIVFAPDRHLGRWVMKQTGREMALWPGFCVVHEQFTARKLIKLRREYPEAELVAHPECEQSVLDMADYIGSTNQLIEYVVNTKSVDEFIVATEMGVMHQMRKRRPGVRVIGAEPASGCECAVCPYMRLNTMEKLYLALRDLKPQVDVPAEIAARAVLPVERMLALG
ncbi:MAG: quinolinate synthase NadA [Planctomycetota bacterium]|nr:quinolinate synthase NadA [Planctomycetota bacterium]